MVTFPFSINLGRQKRNIDSEVRDDYLHDMDNLMLRLGIEDKTCIESIICTLQGNKELYHPLPNIIEKLLLQ